jgi:hypothetical protein
VGYYKNASGPETATESNQSWYATLLKADGLGASSAVFDPQGIYDAFEGHYVMSAIASANTGVQHLYLSVSLQSSVLGNWCNFDLAGPSSGVWPSNNFIDYDQLGMNDTFLTMGLDLIDPSGNTQSRIIDINLSDLYSAAASCGSSSLNYQYWSNLYDPYTGAVACVPVDEIPVCEQTNVNDEPALHIVASVAYEQGTPAYLVDSYPGGGCDVTLWTLSGTSTANASLSSAQVPVLCYDPPPNADQAGSSEQLATGFTAVKSASDYAGQVTFAFASAYSWSNSCPDNAVVEFAFVDPQSGSVTMNKRFGYPCNNDFFPALQLLGNGNFVIGFASSAASYDPQFDVLGYTAAGAPESVLLVNGTNVPDTNDIDQNTGLIRWGDYQAARLDPADVTKAWIIGEYTLPASWDTSQNSWATMLAQVTA